MPSIASASGRHAAFPPLFKKGYGSRRELSELGVKSSLEGGLWEGRRSSAGRGRRGAALLPMENDFKRRRPSSPPQDLGSASGPRRLVLASHEQDGAGGLATTGPISVEGA